MSAPDPCPVCEIGALIDTSVMGSPNRQRTCSNCERTVIDRDVYAQGDGTVGPNMSPMELALRLDNLVQLHAAAKKRADDILRERGMNRLWSYHAGVADGYESAMIQMGMRPQ